MIYKLLALKYFRLINNSEVHFSTDISSSFWETSTVLGGFVSLLCFDVFCLFYCFCEERHAVLMVNSRTVVRKQNSICGLNENESST